MKRSSNGTSMGNAIVYECVKTITEIHPSSAMLGVASHSLELFLHSNSPANLKVRRIMLVNIVVHWC
jgi:hypothetical protein